MTKSTSSKEAQAEANPAKSQDEKPVAVTAPAPEKAPAAAKASAPAKAPTPAKAAPVKTSPAKAPTANVVTTTAGAASTAPAKPAESKPVASANSNQASDEVTKAINNWANAWSRKDVKGYIAQYAADFNVPRGMSRKEWEAERAQRIAGKSGKISVTFDEPQISVNGDKATAKFRQHYKARGLSNSTSKTLVFVRSGNRWLIQEENSR